jgi:hypothetical protein
MWRWIMLFLLVLGAACGSPIPQGAGKPPGTLTSPIDASTTGIQTVVRQELAQSTGGHFVLQFNALPDADTRLELEEAGIQLGEFIPQSAYEAYLPGNALPTLEKMMKAGELRYVGPIPPEAKLQPELAAKIQADPQASYEVVVQFFAEPPEQTMKQLEGWLEMSSSSFGPVNIVEGKVKGTDVDNILALPLVKWVEERVPADLGGG